MTTPYYTADGAPPASTRGTSSPLRAEFIAIQTGFASAQTDITTNNTTLTNSKANKAGDTYTGTADFTGGTVLVPTQTAGDNSTKAASTAFVATAGLNASLPGQTNNAGKFVTTNGTNASWAFTTISKSFTSAEQTITVAGALTLAHGLAVIPPIVLGYLKCTSAELGYSIGDVLCVPLGQANEAVADLGVSVVADATNLNVRYGGAAPVFSVLNKTTGVGSQITPAKWTFSLRAYA